MTDILDEWKKHQEATFNFMPSKGEPFSMTLVEVADAMAFVRELKAKADKESARNACPKCGIPGEKDTYNPDYSECAFCGKYLTT